MKLYVDLETLRLIEAPGFRNPVQSIRIKRGDAAQLQVMFLLAGATATQIGDPATLTIGFGVKSPGGFSGEYLVYSDDWTFPEVAPDVTDNTYLTSPSFNTEALNAALGIGGATELAEISLIGEISWTVDGGAPTSTRTFTVIVENDVIRGTEGTPLANPDPEAWLAERMPVSPLTLYVRSNGSDDTAMPGRMDAPWQSLQGAFVHARSNGGSASFLFDVGAGAFNLALADDGVLNVRGAGKDLTTLTITGNGTDGTPPVNAHLVCLDIPLAGFAPFEIGSGYGAAKTLGVTGSGADIEVAPGTTAEQVADALRGGLIGAHGAGVTVFGNDDPSYSPYSANGAVVETVPYYSGTPGGSGKNLAVTGDGCSVHFTANGGVAGSAMNSAGGSLTVDGDLTVSYASAASGLGEQANAGDLSARFATLEVVNCHYVTVESCAYHNATITSMSFTQVGLPTFPAPFDSSTITATTLGVKKLAGVQHLYWAAKDAIPCYGASGPSVGLLENTSSHIGAVTYDFDGMTTTDSIVYLKILPHWNKGTVRFRPMWTAATGTAGDGVLFSFTTRCVTDGMTLLGSPGGAQTSADTLTTVDRVHLGPWCAAHTVQNIPTGIMEAIIAVKVTRNYTDVLDTLAGDVKLLGVWVEYTEANAEEPAVV